MLFVSSNISNNNYSYGVIYSVYATQYSYQFVFQNCTFEKLTTTSTMGGAISVFPINTNLTLDNCTFTGITLTGASVSGGYIYVATNPGEIHITNSIFPDAVVLCDFFFFFE
jgi:hypothetical protein